jgi:photosystem II stability/assembly factor-like uncharacterized protein
MKNIALAVFLITASCYSQWVTQNTTQYLQTINSINFVNENVGFAVGDSGTIIITVNGGLDWENRNLSSKINLNSVKLLTFSDIIICADSGKIYKSINSGTNWINVSSIVNKKMYNLYFSDANTGYCTGENYVLKTTNAGSNWQNVLYRPGTTFFSSYFVNNLSGWVSVSKYNNTPSVYKTLDGGITWDSAVQTNPQFSLMKLFFINENTGWGSPAIYNNYKLFKTTDGGKNWSALPTDCQDINGLYFFNSNTGYISGRGFYYTTNGGINWIKKSSAIMTINHLQFLNSNLCFAGTTESLLFKSTDAGSTWLNYTKLFDADLYSIVFLNYNTGYISYQDGSVLKTTNGGNVWFRTQTGLLTLSYFIHFLNAETGWATEYENTIIKTNNGGINWQIISMPQNYKRGIYFINENTGWIAADSGKVYKSINGGYNWSVIQLQTQANLLFIKAFDINNIIVSSYKYDTIASSIYHSSNGGNTWQRVLSNAAPYINFSLINSTIGWAGSTMSHLDKTTNAGLNWFTVYDSNSGMNFMLLDFINENTGWSAYGITSYKTTNGGVSWISKGIGNYYGLTSIEFINENTGWVSGYYGTIYKTTNGGLITVEPISSEIPKSFSIHQNYPNPFNPSTKIHFEIPLLRGVSEGRGVSVNLIIYDALGREIALLVKEQLKPGTYEVEWNGDEFSSGIYFYKLTAGVYTATRKMVLIK